MWLIYTNRLGVGVNLASASQHIVKTSSIMIWIRRTSGKFSRKDRHEILYYPRLQLPKYRSTNYKLITCKLCNSRMGPVKFRNWLSKNFPSSSAEIPVNQYFRLIIIFFYFISTMFWFQVFNNSLRNKFCDNLVGIFWQKGR